MSSKRIARLHVGITLFKGKIGLAFLLLVFALPAFAAGGACPIGANYVNPSNPTGPMVTLASLGVTNCYYVAASGSDTSYDGTTETVSGSHGPWLHAPQMPNCSGNCATVQNQSGGIPAGTGIILRGGDTWHFGNSSATPYAGGTWEWNNGQTPNGTSSKPLYVGVDQTWYSGGAWSRPILTADNPLCNAGTANGTTCISNPSNSCAPSAGSACTGLFYVNSCPYQVGSSNNLVDVTFRQYYIIDNLEMTGLCQSDSGQPGAHDVYMRYGSAQAPLTFTNLYIHGWSHTQWVAPNGQPACSSGVCVNVLAFNGSVINGSVGETVEEDVVDGADSDPIGAGACFGGFYNVAYNAFRYTSQCIPNGLHLFHDNLYEYFYENGHSNLLEDLNESAGADAIYNNLFRHIESGCTSGCGAGLWPSPPSGTTNYMFNNLIYDQGNIEALNIGQNSGNQGTVDFFNNTVEWGNSGAWSNCGLPPGYTWTLNSINNHFIDDSSPYNTSSHCLSPNFTESHDLVMSHSTATTGGYTSSQTFVYSPTLSNSPTVGAGTNEQSFCTAMLGSSDPQIQAAGAACQSDTGYACSYNSTSHAVSCPGRTANLRPSSAVWDAGTYEYGTSAQPPAIPAGVTAVVN
jgi:hypothetical protein